MKKVCAWCERRLDVPEKAGGKEGDERISHGICPSCKDFLRSNRGDRSLQEFLNALGVPVVVLDKTARLKGANRAFCERHGKSMDEMRDLLFGDASECARARLPGGCGRTEHCASCAIRRAIEKTFASGRVTTDVSAEQLVRTGEGTRTVRFRVSAVPARGFVFLRLEELGAF